MHMLDALQTVEAAQMTSWPVVPDRQTRTTIRHTWEQDITDDSGFPRRPDPTIERELGHGWLLPVLLQAESLLYGRWAYWFQLMDTQQLPAEPIPAIDFVETEHRLNPAYKMLEACLNTIPPHGAWRTWDGWKYFDYFLDWLLYAFGHPGQPEQPPEPWGGEGASNRLYQIFCLEAMLTWPYDYFGDILAENQHGRGQGFYPTPINVVKLMTGILFTADDQDYRTKTVMDPCLGTGRMLLLASNHSLRLYGQDIVQE